MELTELKKTGLRLSSRVRELKHRRVYYSLKASLFKEPRIKLLRGFRGSGKTTILLQLLEEFSKKAIYVPADNPIVLEEDLYELLKETITSGYSLLLIDEIHIQPKWKAVVKALYDEFPEVTFVCSGSAPLAFVPERREEVIEVEPMSFSEYLSLKQGIKLKTSTEWTSEEKSMRVVAEDSPRIESFFKEYLETGGYPTCLSYDHESSKKALYSSIRKSIQEDSVSFLKMSKEKVFAMNKLVIFLATSLPGELSITSLSSSFSVSKTTVYEILEALEGMKIIRVIRPHGRGGKLVRGEPKMLFYHPNLRVAVCNELGEEAGLGALREELAVFSLVCRGFKVNTVKGVKKSPDYYIGKPLNTVIEIGGLGKTKKQLKGFKKGIVLKPDQLVTLSLF